MPVSTTTHPPEPLPSPDARAEARGARRVIVADADDRVLTQLRAAVSEAGYAVETVSTAHALLEAVRRMPTHLIALAIDLPDMTAAAVIEKVHASCAAPPIILLARHGNDPRRDPLVRTAAACLFKPVEPDRFLGICERVLRLADQRLREGDWRSEPRRALHASVEVEAGTGAPIAGKLVNLSPRGFRIELPEAIGMGRSVKVGVRIPHSGNTLTFEGRILWEKPLAEGTLAGGDLVTVGSEDERILAALV